MSLTTNGPAAKAAELTSKFVDEDVVADVTGRSVRTVQRWRAEGTGPVYYKFGQAVRYTIADLMAWAEAHRRHSTAEPVPAPAVAAEQPIKRKRGWPLGRKRGPRKAPTPTAAAAE